MVYSDAIEQAVRLATQTHEVSQKQKRKGKDIPYITHPLTVGLILARAGVDEDVVVAGILHDTVEDSVPEHRVTREMIAERFGERVASAVEGVTEPDKTLSWEERKREALEHIGTLSHDALLVKSADTLSNVSELADDWERDGDETFARFDAPKDRIVGHYIRIIDTVVARWRENPLAADLEAMAHRLRMMVGGE